MQVSLRSMKGLLGFFILLLGLVALLPVAEAHKDAPPRHFLGKQSSKTDAELLRKVATPIPFTMLQFSANLTAYPSKVVDNGYVVLTWSVRASHLMAV